MIDLRRSLCSSECFPVSQLIVLGLWPAAEKGGKGGGGGGMDARGSQLFSVRVALTSWTTVCGHDDIIAHEASSLAVWRFYDSEM